jgi:DNA-directed RNA polymerase specialized sigma24 family protein
MIAQNILEAFGVFAFRFICKKVDVLVRRYGFPRSERESLLQDFACNLHARRAKFDPSVATWEAFVVVVCENHFATLLEHRSAEMRARERENGSLNERIKDTEGKWTEFGSTIPDTQRSRHTGRSYRSDEERWELQQDVADVLASMPPRMRKVCEMIMCGSKTSAAGKLKMSQWSLYEMLERILARFEKAGLRDYLK